MGALRFSQENQQDQQVQEDDREFIASELRSAPPLTRIAELQQVALELSRKKIQDIGKLREWLRVLVAPGASLGGARPKANILDAGSLWIAKFPAAGDTSDIALWEMLLHEMAADCKITVPPSRCIKVSGDYHTFMVRRFDRHGETRRFFTSAMTLLSKQDSEPASYLDLALFLASKGSPTHIEQDLHELFRRVAFNICTANRDDHLRNHGFLRDTEGWRLAPAYDMNPSPHKAEHELGIDENLHMPDLNVLRDTAEYYRLSPDHANVIIDEVLDVTGTWRERAKRLGLAAADLQAMEHLFITEEVESF